MLLLCPGGLDFIPRQMISSLSQSSEALPRLFLSVSELFWRTFQCLLPFSSFSKMMSPRKLANSLFLEGERQDELPQSHRTAWRSLQVQDRSPSGLNWDQDVLHFLVSPQQTKCPETF